MRSSVSVKGMVLALVIFFFGASLLCYVFLYRPKITKVVKGAREISSLNGRVETAIQKVNEMRKEIEEANRDEVNVDYFNRHRIPPEERTPTFLGIVNDVVNQLGIKTVTVEPLPQEESPDYIRYPFLVETKSKYGEIVKFVDSLENSLELNLDELRIEKDPKDPLWHNLKFTVNTFEFTRKGSSPPDRMPEGNGPPIQVAVRVGIEVKRDPFLEKEKVIAVKPKQEERRERLPRLELNAIIDIAGRKIAIINDTVVREGDWIAKHRIVRIGEDQVITMYRRKERILKIEDLVKTEKQR
jgi:Tfp pilus assembly protein PilO